MTDSEDNVLSPVPGNRLSPRNSPRIFSSPPQPHMCVQVICEYQGIEKTCFVNVMSWKKIGLPSHPNAPIPIYGGVQVSLNERSLFFNEFRTEKEKPLAYAVIINPDVLKQSGKNAQNQEDRDYLIDMILDFIENMNENLRFSRKFIILKDRDLTGELKDIWSLIQAKRELESIQSLNNGPPCDENSHPQSPTPTSPQNTKHKRVGGEDGEAHTAALDNSSEQQHIHTHTPSKS